MPIQTGSIRCVPMSPSQPDPKSRKARQVKCAYVLATYGRNGAPSSQPFQSSDSGTGDGARGHLRGSIFA